MEPLYETYLDPPLLRVPYGTKAYKYDVNIHLCTRNFITRSISCFTMPTLCVQQTVLSLKPSYTGIFREECIRNWFDKDNSLNTSQSIQHHMITSSFLCELSLLPIPSSDVHVYIPLQKGFCMQCPTRLSFLILTT